MQSLSPQTQQRPWEEGKKLPLQGARELVVAGWSLSAVFACSEGAGRGREVGACQGRKQAGEAGQQARVPSWAHQGVEQTRCKARGIQGWTMSLGEEDRRAGSRKLLARVVVLAI